MLPEGTDCDVIGLVEDSLEAAVQVFYVRGGRVRGQRGWVVDKVEDVSTAELVEHFLGQVYRDDPAAEQQEDTAADGARPDADARAPTRRPPIPARLRPDTPDGTAAEVTPAGPVPTGSPRLTARRCRGKSSCRSCRRTPPRSRSGSPPAAAPRVSVRVPQRGDKRALLETVTKNATEALALHKTRRASDLTTRSRAMQEIQDALGLDTAPLRIECIDVSNLQGTNVVASMVVFEDGLARKSEYRKFAIRDASDDLTAIYEVVTRRFRRYLAEREAEIAAEANPRRGARTTRPPTAGGASSPTRRACW